MSDGQRSPRALVTHKCIHPYPATEKCPAECVARDRDHSLEEAQKKRLNPSLKGDPILRGPREMKGLEEPNAHSLCRRKDKTRSF